MSHDVHDPAGGVGAPGMGGTDLRAARRVLANPRFLALYLSQILTQVGGNMVLFGLTVQVYSLTRSSTSVSILLLTYLVPAVVFGAVAGVFVDRFDRRLILVATNVSRALGYVALIFIPDQLLLIYLVTILVGSLTTFFAPAEAAMIPLVVKREQLLTANGLFVFALQASFVVGFAALGPLAQNLMGTAWLILIVAAIYGLAGLLCWTLPSAPPTQGRSRSMDSAERAISVTLDQMREGLSYIRGHHNIFWSLTYLAITASLIGVIGVLGPDFAVQVLGLHESDFVIVVLPLAVGLVVGIAVLNAYGRYLPRRRMIEGGMVSLAVALTILGFAQRFDFLNGGGPSLLGVVIVVAFVAGICYTFVAVPAQTSLQEELPSGIRGRVFGVLNMLVSLGSLLPIIVAGPVADLFGTSVVIVAAAAVVGGVGILSILRARPARAGSAAPVHLEPVDPLTITTTSSTLMQPVRLHIIDAPSEDDRPIAILATPVIPGRSGPAPPAEAGAAGEAGGRDGATRPAGQDGGRSS
jgi:MFS family permease